MTSWSWTSFRAVLWAWSRRCRRTVPCRAATRPTAFLRRFDPRFFRARSCWPAASLVAEVLRWRGLGTCRPSEVVRKDATPMSIPVTAPVIGSGERLDLYRDDHEPAGSPSGTLTLHTDLPQDGALREVPVQAHLNVTHPLDLEPFGRGQELDPVPVPEVHTLEPGGGPKPWVPRRLARLHPPEERPKRLIPVSYTHLRAHETDSYLV